MSGMRSGLFCLMIGLCCCCWCCWLFLVSYIRYFEAAGLSILSSFSAWCFLRDTELTLGISIYQVDDGWLGWEKLLKMGMKKKSVFNLFILSLLNVRYNCSILLNVKIKSKRLKAKSSSIILLESAKIHHQRPL